MDIKENPEIEKNFEGQFISILHLRYQSLFLQWVTTLICGSLWPNISS
jgi:hypothetical protein